MDLDPFHYVQPVPFYHTDSDQVWLLELGMVASDKKKRSSVVDPDPFHYVEPDPIYYTNPDQVRLGMVATDKKHSDFTDPNPFIMWNRILFIIRIRIKFGSVW